MIEDASLDLIRSMVQRATPHSNNFLVVGPFASSTWFVDAVAEAVSIHHAGGDNVLVNRLARAVYGPEGRTFRVVASDAPTHVVAGVSNKAIYWDPSARVVIRGGRA